MSTKRLLTPEETHFLEEYTKSWTTYNICKETCSKAFPNRAAPTSTGNNNNNNNTSFFNTPKPHSGNTVGPKFRRSSRTRSSRRRKSCRRGISRRRRNI
jgi:hypothetical protein